ncbi:tripartite tricarboxylate transporter TctB family protein [Paenibacillus beijingensis]|uniref:DUF1468 domain-containing protein n=1 Tax=Paenibacillus beijingensis TaxID=1126833 RepID=A0A0D5NH18_9BACL|nr:tripartite tricarboxylate transporter TctB family protein [Paenibacillus beijingensis]AJY74203.1 hypothetical protein VN24_05965 [Paenibacillus beijingensis]
MNRNGNKFTADRIGGIATVIIGGITLTESARLYAYRTDVLIGDHVLPAIVGILLCLLGLALTLKKPEERAPEPFPKGKSLFVLFAAFALLVLYRYLIPVTGYFVSTLLVSAGLFKVIGAYRWPKTLLYAGLTAALLYVIFVYWLQTPFPGAILHF